jgi:nucleotide-binding universal stress UspA family protein
MRILLAVDGSPASSSAVDLVASSPWPEPTLVRIVLVDHSLDDLNATPWLGEPILERPTPSRTLTRDLHAIVDGVQERLLAAGVAASGVVVRGRPATEIVREAGEWPADMVVVGSRGHGAIERMLLGSTSAEVVDRAPCPVLIARTAGVATAVVAVDGSPCADGAVSFLVTHRLFPEASIKVVSVNPRTVLADATAFGLSAAELSIEAEAEARAWHADVANRVADDLRRDGRRAETVVRDGNAANEILDVARDADLVVVGTRGNTGLRRILLGSTARNVLSHAHASVLVVRQARRRVEAPERAGRRPAVAAITSLVAAPA